MYSVIRQNRKSVVLTLDKDGKVIMKVPFYFTDSEIIEIANKQKKWIHTQNEMHKQVLEIDWLKTKEIKYLGKTKKIYIDQSKTKQSCLQYKDDIFYITVPKDTSDIQIKKLMENYYREAGKKYLKQRVKFFCRLLGVECGTITVRKQKTRWGSCSQSGNLSFNVKLMMTPEEVIDYIVLHEVMHLRYFNHGSVFWESIERIMPEYKKYEMYLKEHSRFLNF
ncbi:MAG: M48 family metallopeptidase [Cellulosilyticaceae bacterium]